MTTDKHPDEETIYDMKQQYARQQAYIGVALLVILVILMVLVKLLDSYLEVYCGY